VYQYQHDFIDAYHNICTRGRTPILCGGSGLYLESVLRNYHLSTVPQNPSLRCELEGKSLEELKAMLEKLKKLNHSVMHNVTDVDTCKRAIRAIEIERHHLEHPVENTSFPQIESVIFGLNLDRDLRRQMITERLENRLAHGLVDEIKSLLDKGVAATDLIYYGLEYKYVTEYVIGDLTYEQMFHQLEISIHQFAKRQMTWFRGMERRGISIHWIDASLPMDEKVDMTLNYNDDANN
jgi:tRNA dimethylallyltransferase